MFKHFDYLQTINSTNTYLKQFTEERVPRVAMAREQTAGKGRNTRSWYSPDGEGLYVSYLLYPDWETDFSVFLNMMSSLAVVSAIRQQAGSGLAMAIKPPNDILIGGRKVCGILIELSSLLDRINWTIIGIGINLYQRVFPDELKSCATSLVLEGVMVSHPLDLCDHLTHELERIYKQLEMGHWDRVQEEFEQEKRSRSMGTLADGLKASGRRT